MKLFLTGGFLGSGKTTAIQKAVSYLHGKNKRVGVITNDQGDKQVDTAFIKGNNIAVEEVAGSCFCCNYPALEKGISALREAQQIEIIFAESVGSCTDLAATIINPLLSLSPGEYEIVLSVFADIRLLVMYLQNGERLFFDDVTYIFKKQLEEADVIVVNKIDLITTQQLQQAQQLINAAYSNKKILYQNSLSAQSIKAWVDVLCNSFTNHKLREVLNIDYDIYGSGEALLTWLDEDITITAQSETAVEVAYTLIDKIYNSITAGGYPIGHIKCLIDTGLEQQKISFTSIYTKINSTDKIEETTSVNMLINARVQAQPHVLQHIVSDAIKQAQVDANCMITENKLSCFTPGYPRPTHRVAG